MSCLYTNLIKLKMKKLVLILLLSTSNLVLFSQDLTQNIKGLIIDEDSKMPIVGATITIQNSNPLLGTASDIDGNFKIESVPVGRVTVQVSFIGYEPRTISNIDVNSGKEVYLEISLIEDVKTMEILEVEAYRNTETINDMSIISTKMVTVEETKRYAGSLNDPARMVASYAGVGTAGDGNNDIVVRGNSPKGILWRLEGVEIPNPNHFSDEGATGGPINALNSSMLANSDFSTGAFAPEYGNATSGVFDMKLRKGNSDKREYTFGIGAIGMEAALEGPFKNGGKASYLVNYRYSTLSILDATGIIDFGGIPKYQDGSFNINVPTKKLGTFTAFGLGGISHIAEEGGYNRGNDSVIYKERYNSFLGTAGITNTYLINNNSFLKTVASISTNGSGSEYEEKIIGLGLPENGEGQLQKITSRIASTYNRKFSAKTKMSTGLIYTSTAYDFFLEYEEEGAFFRPLDETGSADMVQGFVSLKHRFTEDITIIGGVHYLQFLYNNSNSIEPRLAVQWKTGDNQVLSLGYGKHSKLESMLDYTTKLKDQNGNTYNPNKNLDLPKANHYVLGYQILLTENLNMKAEVYYQQLYDVPVENNDSSFHSIINQSDWFAEADLVNDGEGRNYGLELTLERFFANNYYFLFTGSLYNSEYAAKDGVWRNTRFNGNYNFNFLTGKEFKVGKNKTLTANIKSSWLGANRFTPVDLEKSRLVGRTIRDESKVFETKAEDIFFINLGGSFKVNQKKTTHELKLEILNITNNQATSGEYYDVKTDKIESYSNQWELIPNLIYTVSF